MMICPSCGHDKTDVVDSRPTIDSVRRRRRCMGCKHQWTTMEVAIEDHIDVPAIERKIAAVGKLMAEIKAGLRP